MNTTMNYPFLHKRHEYEAVPDHHATFDGIEDGPLLDSDRPEEDRRHVKRFFLVNSCSSSSSIQMAMMTLLSLVSLFLIVTREDPRFYNMFRPPKMHSLSKETTPTLLSVVDPATDHFLLALNNPLYQQVQQAQTAATREVDDKKMIQEHPTLTLDRTTVEYHEPLTLSWTLGSTLEQQPVVTDDSVLLLICYNNKDEEYKDNEEDRRGRGVLLEAVTLAQAKATSRYHFDEQTGSNNHSNDTDNSWFIPRIPVLRHDSCQFQLYPSLQNWRLVAESERFYPIHRPTAIHLALSHDPTEMVVSFVSGGSTSHSPMTPIVCLVDENDQDIIVFDSGKTETYTANDLCQAPANITEPGKFQSPGWLHTVKITGLEPNTRYRYRVGIKKRTRDSYKTTFSKKFEFTSALPPGDPEPFSYIVYGDQGCPSVGWGQGGRWTAAMAAREIIDAGSSSSSSATGSLPIRSVHHFGDLSYARGAAHIWDEWFAMIEVLSAYVPLMVSVGNHEYDHTDGGGGGRDPSGLPTAHGFMPKWGNFGDDSGGECGVPTAKRFSMPQSPQSLSASSSSNGVFWYSYDQGSLHTVVLSSEHDLGRGSPQHIWLEQDLKSVNRLTTPWLVVELHRALYNGEAAWDQNAVGIGMRLEMEDLLYDNKVDLVLAGHYHAYLRTCDGLYRGKCQQGGPMHITVGTAGASLDENVLYNNGWTDKYIMGQYGYGRITVANASAMHFEFVKAGDANDTTAGTVQDDVWIVRRR